METTFNPFRDLDMFPVDIIDGMAHVSPEAIIEWAMNKHRKSLYPDNELAKYICELLSYIMEKNSLIISSKNVKDSNLINRFRILQFEKAKE